MARWKRGQDIYIKLMSNLAENVSNTHDTFGMSEHNIVAYAKTLVPEFVNTLRVAEVILIHEYLMYKTEVRKDIRVPAYEYSGGDRIAAVARYMQKHMHLELAKLYV